MTTMDDSISCCRATASVCRRVALDGPLRTCHLLYVSGVTAAQVSAIVTIVKGAPVLTISDIDDFAPLGGIAHMCVEDRRMRFASMSIERNCHGFSSARSF